MNSLPVSDEERGDVTSPERKRRRTEEPSGEEDSDSSEGESPSQTTALTSADIEQQRQVMWQWVNRAWTEEQKRVCYV